MGLDVTERKNAETALINAKEIAERSDRLKTAFINNISHEIRTPLNSIAGFGQLLLSEELSRHQRMKYLDILEQNSDRLLQTITDILDISMIASDNMTIFPKDVKLDDILSDIMNKAQLLSANTNIIPGLQIPEGAGKDKIYTDPEMIEKTFWHLVSNAVKFTEKGRITIGYELINDEWIQFFVRDSGRGIAATNLEKIFEAFVQEDISITRGHEGSGMGLTIAKGMVGLLGGKIWAESTQGEGSTFYFTIPAKPEKKNRKKQEKKPLKIMAKEDPVILVAEDDESNYYYFQELLETTGVSHLHALNGKQAVEMCQEYPGISLVLMDIKMPVMNGIEATRQIKLFRPELPIIAVTAHAQTGDRSRILDAGCDYYLTKPVPKKTLETMIRQYIQIS